MEDLSERIEKKKFARDILLSSFSIEDIRDLLDYQDGLGDPNDPDVIKQLVHAPITPKFEEKFANDYKLLNEGDSYVDVLAVDGVTTLEDELQKDTLVNKLVEAIKIDEVNSRRLLNKNIAPDLKARMDSCVHALRVRLNVLAYLYIDSPLSPKSLDLISSEETTAE